MRIRRLKGYNNVFTGQKVVYWNCCVDWCNTPNCFWCLVSHKWAFFEVFQEPLGKSFDWLFGLENIDKQIFDFLVSTFWALEKLKCATIRSGAWLPGHIQTPKSRYQYWHFPEKMGIIFNRFQKVKVLFPSDVLL